MAGHIFSTWKRTVHLYDMTETDRCERRQLCSRIRMGLMFLQTSLST